MSPDLSFPPERRLSRSKVIQSILDDGTIFKGDYCHTFVGDRDEDPTRAAFVVSRKSARKATDRNRIKRIMRESFRLLQPDLEEGWPLVFVATRQVHGDLNRQDVDEDIRGHLSEAGILRGGESS